MRSVSDVDRSYRWDKATACHFRLKPWTAHVLEALSISSALYLDNVGRAATLLSSIDSSAVSGFGCSTSIFLLEGESWTCRLHRQTFWEPMRRLRHVLSVGVVLSHNTHRLQAGSAQCYSSILFSFNWRQSKTQTARWNVAPASQKRWKGKVRSGHHRLINHYGKRRRRVSWIGLSHGSCQ